MATTTTIKTEHSPSRPLSLTGATGTFRTNEDVFRNMPSRARLDLESVTSDDQDVRVYVSALWARDWDSPADAVYDDA